MEIIDRLFILLFALILMIVSIGIMGISSGLIDVQLISDYINQLENNIESGIIALVLFLMSIRVLQLFFRRKKVKQAMVATNKLGNVKITLDAINSLVKEVVNQENKINDIQSKIKVKDTGIHIYLKLAVIAGTDIPELTDKLQELVKERVTKSTGVKVDKVEILVKEINRSQELRVD